ncbi:TIGR04139 family peptide modification target [Chryseobacterium sp. WG14]|uniref:TIGR04139 family peptide modification target n=1 Tax=unclassified Chryseobacterium TaxID=2593645 RepID=UPI001D9BA87F|nr:MULTISPECIES: TIGR04139 family peptide modification target [unclassified Chryseobacterium]MCQ9636876.1 TIGR04139 family peptide modification target [Chryseobacterium sp. WG23]MCQ9639904.1 TIGR04139 family peptide modification target [Chryseobacterium sp. WG14]CAH0256780.1 hypothetical protein SRABI04_03378 [Chryseobacterium sp. Bi04]
MKKLTGMKGNFSSTENRKLQRKDLKSIHGGYLKADYSYVATDGGANCYDKQTWKDGTLQSTLYVGC